MSISDPTRALHFVVAGLDDTNLEELAANTATLIDNRAQRGIEDDPNVPWLVGLLQLCRAEGARRLEREMGRPRLAWAAWRDEDFDGPTDVNDPPPGALEF